MNYEAYPFLPNEEKTQFQFTSIGKRGVFSKAVVFSFIEADIYNLALLDVDPVTKEISDTSVTDNGDMPEVLATVMAIANDYLGKYPNCSIYLVGNTASRTRLYQIAISKVIDQIEAPLRVLGYTSSKWVPFEPNRTFEGFLIGRNLLA